MARRFPNHKLFLPGIFQRIGDLPVQVQKSNKMNCKLSVLDKQSRKASNLMKHRNLVPSSGGARREGYIGEGGSGAGADSGQRLPYADFFGYFLVQRQESIAPQGPEPANFMRVMTNYTAIQ